MKAKSMDDKHAAKMKAEAKLDSAPKPKLRPRYQQAAAGRTKNAYDVQPHLLPWKCSVCIEGARQKLLKEADGRGHLSATEVNEHSFDSKAEFESHYRVKHGFSGGHVVVTGGEVPTRNRIKRNLAQESARLMSLKREGRAADSEMQNP